MAFQTNIRTLLAEVVSKAQPFLTPNSKARCHHKKPEELADIHFNDLYCSYALCTLFHNAGLTSDDGQLGIDSNLALGVLSNALIDVLIPWCSERLDSEYGAGTLVKLNGLWGKAHKRLG